MELTRNRWVLVGGGVALVAAVIVAALFMTGVLGVAQSSPSPEVTPSASPSASPTPSPTPSPSPSPEPTPAAFCPYNGLPISDAAVLDRPAMLIQVENNPSGRPTSGLNAADLVVEAPVEGDTTRFGPLYLCGDAPEAIGPVRSARYYNVDLWRQLHEITMHFGGAYLVLTEFDRTGMPYVNGISGTWPFFARLGPRPAPHNVYFDLEVARDAAAAGSFGSRVERAGEPQAPFTFQQAVTYPQGRAVTSITIYTNSFWNFGWAWDPSNASWVRSDSGAPATDALTGEPLRAKTVIVQRVTETILPGELDPGGFPRRRLHMVGSGTGVLYADGQAYDISWSRPSDDELTTWTYADSGEEVVLQPGRIWWEIVPSGAAINER